MRSRIESRLVNAYKKWHWGSDATTLIEWSDPDVLAKRLVEIGRLVELYVRGMDEGTRVKGEMFAVPERLVPHNHVAFDPDHPSDRIYLLAETPLRRLLRRTYWNPGGKTYSLGSVAVAAGGRHARGTKNDYDGNDYPDVAVQPVGILTHVTYLTEKVGDPGEKRLGWDNANLYIHHMGEESGIQPVLCIDAEGRIWMAGGNYTCPTPGITD